MPDLTHKFTILGNPPVKKNSMQITRQGGLVPSAAYRAWIRGAVFQLRSQWKRLPMAVSIELHVKFTFYLGARQKPDLSNLYEAPQDAMEVAGIISNDYWIVSHDGSRRLRDSKNPRIEIELTPLGAEGGH